MQRAAHAGAGNGHVDGVSAQHGCAALQCGLVGEQADFMQALTGPAQGWQLCSAEGQGAIASCACCGVPCCLPGAGGRPGTPLKCAVEAQRQPAGAQCNGSGRLRHTPGAWQTGGVPRGGAVRPCLG